MLKIFTTLKTAISHYSYDIVNFLAPTFSGILLFMRHSKLFVSNFCRPPINRSISLILISCFAPIAECEKFIFEDSERLFGIAERIIALKTYAPGENYCWHLEWKVGKQSYSGRLTAKVEGSHHWIAIVFSDQTTLLFDKNNPQQAFYPHRLCPLLQERWQEPLGGLPSVSYELIAMPFLNDTVVSVKKTAKQGRKALEVDFMREKHISTKAFLDLKFNTILEVQLLSTHPISKFQLKSLKKFNGIWGLHQAVFSQGKIITKLTVKKVETYDFPKSQKQK